jgi:hypothetical protein
VCTHSFGTTKTRPTSTLFVANIPPAAAAWFERVEAVFSGDPSLLFVKQVKGTMVFVDYADTKSATT